MNPVPIIDFGPEDTENRRGLMPSRLGVETTGKRTPHSGKQADPIAMKDLT